RRTAARSPQVMRSWRSRASAPTACGSWTRRGPPARRRSCTSRRCPTASRFRPARSRCPGFARASGPWPTACTGARRRRWPWSGRHGEVRPTGFTTPQVSPMHALLARLRDDGAQAVAMEVSSHALDQGRVDAVHFAVGVFTNLTRDHLDYHGDMDTYGAAKA